MKKSISSKKGSCSSFLTGASRYRDDSDFQMMRIEQRKEKERKERLQKILQNYRSIHNIQKAHLKSLKSSLIELKDSRIVEKPTFVVDSMIMVDNNLSAETRNYFCILLNTFYKRYESNNAMHVCALETVKKIKKVVANICAYEDSLFKVQKLTMNQQINMEEELIAQKNKLKEENGKTKGLKTQFEHVQDIKIKQENYKEEKQQKVNMKKKEIETIEQEIYKMNNEIELFQLIKNEKQHILGDEAMYQQKIDSQISLIDKIIEKQKQKQSMLKKSIMKKKIKIQQMKGEPVQQFFKHNINMKILEICKRAQNNLKLQVAKDNCQIKRFQL